MVNDLTPKQRDMAMVVQSYRPRNVFVAGFIGSPGMNLLPGEIGNGSLLLDPDSGERLQP